MPLLFCAYREWSIKLFKKLAKKYDDITLLSDPKRLTFRYVKKINPEYIFFPDWSWIVPKKIINNYKCICFHESDLPKFRGGSPIQNQIIRGITKTKTTAFLMTEHLDEGNILLQKDLSLEGSLEDVFKRMIKNDCEIIIKIINGRFKPRKQTGKPTFFRRRRPDQSELKNLDFSKHYLYNFFRMLEDPYPNAFIRIGKRKIIFKSTKYDGKKLEFVGELV